MNQRPRLDWHQLGIELFIVFVGLLAALQVDGWREERQFREAEKRYLVRLRQDLENFLQSADSMLPFLERNFDAVRHVGDSLAAGRVLDGESRKFETGLVYVGHLPSIEVPRSAYDEMVASGMFARLRSEPLKREISRLYATQSVVDKNFAWWRNSVEMLQERLFGQVRFYSGDGRDPLAGALVLNEPVRRAEFDFDVLREDPYIVNGFYWATDTHSDWVHWTRSLRESARQAAAVLDEELSNR